MASHGILRRSGNAEEKSEQAREKERRQIEQYKALEGEVNVKIQAGDFSNYTLQLTSKLLTQNPEYYTIWNYRRLILEDVINKELSASPPSTAEAVDVAAAEKAGHTPSQHEISLLLKEDLAFLVPLLRQYPKCYWIWNHRSWLLRAATTHLPAASAVELWQGELGLVGKMLSLDARNFHGWGYRRKCIATLEQLGSNGSNSSTSSSSSMAESEFAYTTRMINANLSNFSAWHYRGQLLPRLLRERGANSAAREAAFDAEFELITRALYTDPYDQSLWGYHQYLMAALDARNPAGAGILQPCANADRLRYLEQEIDSIRDMLDGAEDCKYIYQALLEYSQRYLDVEAGNKKVTSVEMKGWLDELRKIDPLREGRWADLATKLNL